MLWNDRDWFFGTDVALFLMDRMMSSIQRLKRMALRGHPCLTPDRIGMGSVDSVEDGGGGTGVYVGDERDQGVRQADVLDSGFDGGVWQVEPDHVGSPFVDAGVSYDGLEEVGVLIAAFGRSSALLLRQEYVVVDGPGRNAFA